MSVGFLRFEQHYHVPQSPRPHHLAGDDEDADKDADADDQPEGPSIGQRCSES